jgi:hypothetical protein
VQVDCRRAGAEFGVEVARLPGSALSAAMACCDGLDCLLVVILSFPSAGALPVGARAALGEVVGELEKASPSRTWVEGAGAVCQFVVVISDPKS